MLETAPNLDWYRLAVDVGQFAVTGAVGVYVWFVQREQVRREALQRLETDVDDRLDDVISRLAKIETNMGTQPTWQACSAQHARIAVLERAIADGIKGADISRVHQRIDEVAEGLAGVRGEIIGMQRLLHAIDQHLRAPHHSPHG